MSISASETEARPVAQRCSLASLSGIRALVPAWWRPSSGVERARRRPWPSSTLSATTLLERLGVPAAAVRDGDLVVAHADHRRGDRRVTAPTCAATTRRSARAAAAFVDWRDLPGPQRGEIVRQLGEELRARQGRSSARLVTLEVGKIALGGPRRGAGDDRHGRLRGRPVAPALRPLDAVRAPAATACTSSGIRSARSAIITAFNFPVAVWAWNAALALVCGDSVIWKPSQQTPLTALAVQPLVERACRAPAARRGIFNLVIGRPPTGAASSPTIRACRSSRPPARPHGPRGRRRASPPASAARCSSSAATTASWRRRRRPRSRRARRRSSPPSAPPASAARRRAACSCTRRSPTR